MKVKDEAKAKRIKKVTLELTSKEGIAGLKISKIAKSAGYAPSMLYTYFKNKEELLFEVHRDSLRKIAVDYLSKLDHEKPYKARMFDAFQSLLNLSLSKSLEFNFLKSYAKSPYFDKEMHENVIKEEENPIAALFMEGMNAMILKEKVSKDLMFAMLIGFTEKIVELQHTGKFELNDELIQDAFKMFWDAIRQ